MAESPALLFTKYEEEVNEGAAKWDSVMDKKSELTNRAVSFWNLSLGAFSVCEPTLGLKAAATAVMACSF